MTLEQLKHPIGKANIPEKISKENIQNWIAILEEFPQKLEDLTIDLSEEQLHGLFHKYGSNASQIIEMIDWKNSDRTLAILLAELKYSVENEMIAELSDFLIRRTGRLYFEKPVADKYAEALNAELTSLLGLNSAESKASLKTYLNESEDVLNFTNE